MNPYLKTIYTYNNYITIIGAKIEEVREKARVQSRNLREKNFSFLLLFDKN
jgi:hypothetical protein